MKLEKLEEENVIHPGDEFSQVEHAKKEKERNIFYILLISITLISAISYVTICSFMNQYWPILWTIMFSGILISYIYKSIKTAKMVDYPIAIACVTFYIPFAYTYNLWHPLWTIFLVIPIYYMIGEFIDRKIRIKE